MKRIIYFLMACGFLIYCSFGFGGSTWVTDEDGNVVDVSTNGEAFVKFNTTPTVNSEFLTWETNIVVAISNTTAEVNATFKGRMTYLIFTVPDLTSTHTAELIIEDPSNRDIYTTGEKAESTTYGIAVTRDLCDTATTFNVETSASETDAAVTNFVKVYYVK